MDKSRNEYAARATVQKARDFLGTIEIMEAQEAAQREKFRKEEISRIEKEHANLLSKQSPILLLMFDELAKSDDPHRRGYLLQNLIEQVFDLHGITVHKSFTRNDGGEQIDGGFILDGWHYLVECRWRKKLADIRELDGLWGQISRSGKQSMGLFLSINGWSENVPLLLKQNTEKSVILMDGYDLRCILTCQVGLKELIFAKIAKLNFDCEPYYGFAQYMSEKRCN